MIFVACLPGWGSKLIFHWNAQFLIFLKLIFTWVAEVSRNIAYYGKEGSIVCKRHSNCWKIIRNEINIKQINSGLSMDPWDTPASILVHWKTFLYKTTWRSMKLKNQWWFSRTYLKFHFAWVFIHDFYVIPC